MALCVGNNSVGRVWTDGVLARAVANGSKKIFPRGCGAVLRSSMRIDSAAVFQSLYQWTNDSNLYPFYAQEGDANLELRFASVGGRFQPYIYVINNVSNVALSDFVMSAFASVNSTWNLTGLIVRASATNYFLNSGSLVAGNYDDVPLYMETAGQTWNTGPLSSGHLIYPCCFGTSTTGSLVISNISWKAVSS